jgi:hypothetical protein
MEFNHWMFNDLGTDHCRLPARPDDYHRVLFCCSPGDLDGQVMAHATIMRSLSTYNTQ